MGKYCQHCGTKYHSAWSGNLVSPFAGSGGGYCSAVCRAASVQNDALLQQAKAQQKREAAFDRQMQDEEDREQLKAKLDIIWQSDPAHKKGLHPIDLWDCYCDKCHAPVLTPHALPACPACSHHQLGLFCSLSESRLLPGSVCGENITSPSFRWSFALQCGHCGVSKAWSQRCPTCKGKLPHENIRAYRGGGFELMDLIHDFQWLSPGPLALNIETTKPSAYKPIPSVADLRKKYSIPPHYPILAAFKFDGPFWDTETPIGFGIATKLVIAGSRLFFRDADSNQPYSIPLLHLAQVGPSRIKKGWFSTTIDLGGGKLKLQNDEVETFTLFITHLTAHLNVRNTIPDTMAPLPSSPATLPASFTPSSPPPLPPPQSSWSPTPPPSAPPRPTPPPRSPLR